MNPTLTRQISDPAPFKPLARWAIFLLALLWASASFAAGVSIFETPDEKEMKRAARSLEDNFESAAYKKFQRAAGYGNKQAQQNLGVMCYEGLGVNKNRARAYAWFKLSATLNDEGFALARDKVFGILTDEQKAEAETYYQAIEEEYGDAAALKRREKWVRKEKRQATGSRVGTVGALRMQVTDTNGNITELTGVEYHKALETYITDLKIRIEQNQDATAIAGRD
jgi:hypothetical protein